MCCCTFPHWYVDHCSLRSLGINRQAGRQRKCDVMRRLNRGGVGAGSPCLGKLMKNIWVCCLAHWERNRPGHWIWYSERGLGRVIDWIRCIECMNRIWPARIICYAIGGQINGGILKRRKASSCAEISEFLVVFAYWKELSRETKWTRHVTRVSECFE